MNGISVSIFMFNVRSDCIVVIQYIELQSSTTDNVRIILTNRLKIPKSQGAGIEPVAVR